MQPSCQGPGWGQGRVLTIFSGVTDDSVWFRALPKVIFCLDSDLIGHVDRGLPHHIAGAPHSDIVPGLSGLSPPPLDDVAQVGAKGGGGVHRLSRERDGRSGEGAGEEPRPPTARTLSVPGTLPQSAQQRPAPWQSWGDRGPHSESPQSLESCEASSVQILHPSPSPSDSTASPPGRCTGSESFIVDRTLSCDAATRKQNMDSDIMSPKSERGGVWFSHSTRAANERKIPDFSPT